MITRRSLIVGLLAVVSVLGCKNEKHAEYIHVGENWAFIHAMDSPENTFPVTLKAPKHVTVGEKIHFEVKSARAGKLWIVQVDPEDHLTVFFPNEKTKDNRIEANKALIIPPQDAAWYLQASEPLGKSIIACVVTTGDTELSGALNERNSMEKAIQLIEESPTWGLDKVVIEVEKGEGQ